MKQLQIRPIEAFESNYIWCLSHGSDAAVVCPGEAAPVISYLKKHNLELRAILVTHHHWDHVNGIEELKKLYPQAVVCSSTDERVPACDRRLSEGEELDLGNLGTWQIIEVPGHTIGHIGFYSDGRLLIGDTLFAAGCGRLFEGTPAQMVSSFDKIRRLPPGTLIYCAHEYTLANLDFALAVEPENSALVERREKCSEMRRAGRPTVPFSLTEELATNPFLRCGEEAIQQAASEHCGRTVSDEVETFAVIRKWKDNF